MHVCLPSRAAEQGCLTASASFMACIKILTGGSQDIHYMPSLQYDNVEL